MKLGRRRILQLLALLALLVAGLAIYTYFVGTRTLLQHAEAFAFRRMTVTQLSEPGVFQFFYVSNRRPDAPDGDIEERFTSERETSLKFGFFNTRIEPTLGLGMIIDPSKWFLNEEIRLLDVRAQEKEAFLEQLRQHVSVAVAGCAWVSGGLSVGLAQDRFPGARTGHQHTGTGIRLAG